MWGCAVERCRAVAGQLAGIGAATVRRREEDISEASTQGVRSGGRQRTAGSGVNGSRTRSTKRSGRRERTQAYGVVSVRKTRKHDGVDVPTWTPQHQREAEGNRFRKLPNGGPLHSLLSLITERIFSSILKLNKWGVCPDTEGGVENANYFNSCSRCERK